jgi:hypothetical protein
MEMPVMSASWIKLSAEYLRDRFPLRLYLPGAAFLVVAGQAGGQELSLSATAGGLLLALMLLLQFRLMDDLGDLRHDRLHHPERVVVKAVSLTPFYLLLCCSFTVNLLLVTTRPGPEHSLWLVLLLSAVAVLWYRYLRHVLTGRILGYHLLLAKYPLFAYLLSGNGNKTRPLMLSLGFVYLCFTLYEALHDRSLQTLPGITNIVLVEIAALFVLSVLMTIEIGGGNPVAVVLQGLLSAVIFGAFMKIRQVNLATVHTGYAVFILGMATVVNFSIGVHL